MIAIQAAYYGKTEEGIGVIITSIQVCQYMVFRYEKRDWGSGVRDQD